MVEVLLRVATVDQRVSCHREQVTGSRTVRSNAEARRVGKRSSNQCFYSFFDSLPVLVVSQMKSVVGINRFGAKQDMGQASSKEGRHGGYVVDFPAAKELQQPGSLPLAIFGKGHGEFVLFQNLPAHDFQCDRAAA